MVYPDTSSTGLTLINFWTWTIKALAFVDSSVYIFSQKEQEFSEERLEYWKEETKHTINKMHHWSELYNWPNVYDTKTIWHLKHKKKGMKFPIDTHACS